VSLPADQKFRALSAILPAMPNTEIQIRFSTLPCWTPTV
jgi:hypothetical protein